QGCIPRNDTTGTPSAIAQGRRNSELARAADFHALHAFVPAGDHLTATQRKLERRVAILAGVEFTSVGQPTCVMDGGLLASSGHCALAHDDFLDAETTCRLSRCHQN